jgi:hypothetical protein
MSAMKTSHLLLILFVVAAILLLTLLPQREGYKTGHTPPLEPTASMNQVVEGTNEMGHDGYIRDMVNRISKLEQTYPDIPDDS